MTTKDKHGASIDPNKAEPQTPDERATQSKATDALMQQTDVERLKAERDRLNKEIRQASRKSAPKAPALTLSEVEAKQSEKLNIYLHDIVCPLVAQRVKAGDSPELAWQSLAALYAPTVLRAVEVHATIEGISWDDAVASALGRTRTRKAAN